MPKRERTRDEADAATSNDTADAEEGKLVGGGDLEDAADNEDGTAYDDGPATPDEVGNIAGNQSAEEGAGGQDGHHQRLLPGGQGKGRGVNARCGRLAGSVVILIAGIFGDEVGHALHARHPTRVIAED